MPFSEGVEKPGRNHNPYGFSMWMAGGGVKGGASYGETDELGFAAAVNKVHVSWPAATKSFLRGVDPCVASQHTGGGNMVNSQSYLVSIRGRCKRRRYGYRLNDYMDRHASVQRVTLLLSQQSPLAADSG